VSFIFKRVGYTSIIFSGDDMNIHSFRTEHFFKLFDNLDPRDREQAELAFKKWSTDQGNERRLSVDSHILTVKLSEKNRAVGVDIDTARPNVRAVVWFFVGKHNDYELLIRSRRLGTQIAHISEKLDRYREKISTGRGLIKPPR
jgi:hypothetical protein